jgi:c(7)-type cytochrome triheme protein
LDQPFHRVRGLWQLWPGLLVVQLFDPAVAACAAGGARDAPRSAPVELRLPADVVYRPAAGSDRAVVFSHRTHVDRAGNRCTGCHPRPFPMLRRGPAPRHGDMDAGRSCGVCHDGIAAFGVRDSTECRTCHSGTGRPGMAAALPGAKSAKPGERHVPRPHTFPRGEASPGRVTFRHETHLRGAKGCAACHPRPFAMKPAAPRPGGGMHERTACGACHDARQAFATADPKSCVRCHAGAEARR